MQLAELCPGQRFKVTNVAVGGEIGKRLADMGLVSGAEGEVVRAAFFRGPIQIRLGDYDLIMRRYEARLVDVELLPEAAPQVAGRPPKKALSTMYVDLRPRERRRSHGATTTPSTHGASGSHGIQDAHGKAHGAHDKDPSCLD
ncbi:MAG TPA: FeoA family protein [Rectinema sp.]|nr:ferrous iron transport protein A [Treponema sp.]HPD69746.1 FeoA family protein [Rectinema sp.]HPK79584.1 FeoA family protein [Rectinema sp.]HRS32406.1 FeoA family protein [Rectinema sp.]HRU77917.1 FeoA family protein [Rectinema sp.]